MTHTTKEETKLCARIDGCTCHGIHRSDNMTHNTKEVEDLERDVDYILYNLRNAIKHEAEGTNISPYRDDVKKYKAELIALIHQQLQKAREEEGERIEDELNKHIAPHPLSLEDSVWLKRLLNKVFQHEQRTN